ncbi:ubiquinone biosynthesis O-methyltransferase [Geobacter sp. OR-1]|uniref:class I SAM-dependent methyltransferase n=1 Tax=Geobacter sp. OR-1 TaxID=1266765 RepID=UPI000541FC5A|nr:class I SAM-dependent methyltransferase [Geobacter sp. OR-1]GAM08242.1 ubiquinone biosynthesis O-methyltransferase [Geobacter sp. OR-1]
MSELMGKAGTQWYACALCGSKQSSLLCETRDRHYGIPGEFTIARCNDCGLVFLSPMPTESQLAAFYPDDFYAYQPHMSSSGIKGVLKNLLRMEIKTKDPVFSKPGRMLDIGCGSGQFIAEYRRLGWQVWGVEPSLKAAQFGREQYGLEIFGGTLLEAKLPSSFFDFIRSNHSFEHIPNPNETFEELRRIISPNGLLHIGVPNIDSLNAKIFGKYWWYLGAPVHTYNYSVATLTKMAEKHGFARVRTRYNADYSGIIGSLQIFLNRRSNKTSSEGALINFVPARLLGQWLAKLVNVLQQGDAIELTFRLK